VAKRSADDLRDQVMRANGYTVLRLPASLVLHDQHRAATLVREALDTPWARHRRDSWDHRRRAAQSSSPAARPRSVARSARQQARPRKRRFHCSGCRRTFATDIYRPISCYRCKTSAHLQPICAACSRPTPKVRSAESWCCGACADATDAARAAAGAGAQAPFGQLRQARRGRAVR
jgi:hypothetical protein